MIRLVFSALLISLVLLGGAALAQSDGPNVFKVDALNPGLGTVGDINRDTPQAAVESFLYFAEVGDFEAAAHLLNLARVDVGVQAQAGPELARQLADVIKRKVWIEWDALPDRPDGLDVLAGSNDAMAGQSRRSLRVELINLDGRPIPIRIERVQAGESDPVWVFDAQTVENVPALHDQYGPRAFERAMPDWARQPLFFGLDVWEAVVLPVLILVAFIAGKVLYRIATALRSRYEPGLTGRIFDALAFPLSLISAALIVYFATRTLFVFSVVIDTFMTPALLILLVGGILVVMVRIIDLVIDMTLGDDIAELEKPENRDARAFQTNLSAARRLGIVIIAVAFTGLLLTRINFLESTGIALVGSAGVLTLIVAFAGRSALSNIMASLQIALSKVAAIGDSVLFDGQWSHVEKINFTYVQLKTWDNRRLIVPVTDFVSRPFENWTKRDATMTKLVELRLNHMADVEALRKPFRKFIEDNDKVIDPEDAFVLVTGHDETGMTVGFYASATDPSTGWLMHCELREAMLKAAADLEIEAMDGRRFLPVEREVQLDSMPAANRRSRSKS